MSKTLNIIGRVSLSTGIVVGIGWAFLTLNPPTPEAPTPAVTESEAVIVTSDMADKTSTQKFADSLEKLGHEKPRVYTSNGNEVFFSTRFVENKRPDELVEEYQEEFVAQGLNSQVWQDSLLDIRKRYGSEQIVDAMSKRSKAAMAGEILPLIIDKHHMSMTGGTMDLRAPDEAAALIPQKYADMDAVFKRFRKAMRTCEIPDAEIDAAIESANATNSRDADNVDRYINVAKKTDKCSSSPGVCSEEAQLYRRVGKQNHALKFMMLRHPELKTCGPFAELLAEQGKLMRYEFAKMISSVRAIEAFYDEESNSTAVTATWSEQGFDMVSNFAEEFGWPEQAPVAGNVPACPGCQRTWSFGGHGAEKDYTANILYSGDSVDNVVNFYNDAYSRDGWKPTEATPAINALRERFPDEAPDGATWLQFSRGSEFVVFRVDPNSSGSTAMAVTSH